MKFRRHTSLLLCAEVSVARDFYVRQLALELNVDLGWFVSLAAPKGAGPSFELSLMQVGHPSLSLPSALAGPTTGLLLAFEVQDVHTELQGFQARGANVVSPITEHPWGQRNFCVEAPEGNTIDVFETTAPDPQWLKENGLA